MKQTKQCQCNLQEWGAANSVKFDASKESFHVLHRIRSHGEGFRLLGLSFDEALRMGKVCLEIAREAGWRLQSVLRPRRFFTQRQIINLYKSQICRMCNPARLGITMHRICFGTNRSDSTAAASRIGFDKRSSVNYSWYIFLIINFFFF